MWGTLYPSISSFLPSPRHPLIKPTPNSATYKRFPTLPAAQTYLLTRSPQKAKQSRKPTWHIDAPRKVFEYTPLHLPRQDPTSRPTIPERQQHVLQQYNMQHPEPGTIQTLPFHIAAAREQGFTISRGALVVWTDGSARKNGKSGARAGSGVWWGSDGVARGL